MQGAATARERILRLERERWSLLRQMDRAAPVAIPRIGAAITALDAEQTALLDALQAADPVWRDRTPEAFWFQVERPPVVYRTDAEILDALARCPSQRLAARALGMPQGTICGRLKRIREREQRKAA